MDFFNPSTTEGALVIGIIAGVISGAILGFFSGTKYEKMKISKSKISQKGNGNVAVQNSKIERDLNVRDRKSNSEG
ncbi:hypothetical protein [Paenibacillus naphthalenovorans]|uniref:hypothetical protein n=1 Tax=Paenibacillus naphthalenovorans TaxID=162209 RepID=UPI003D2A4507